VPVRLNTEASSFAHSPCIFVQLKRFTTYRHGVFVSGNGAVLSLFNRTDLVVDPDVADFLGLLGLPISP